MRRRFAWSSAAADVIAAFAAYIAAVAFRNAIAPALERQAGQLAPDLSVLVLVIAMVSVFYVVGLYELESYVSRPLHLWMLLKATALSFAITALFVYAAKSITFDQPRLTLVTTFVVFAALDC